MTLDLVEALVKNCGPPVCVAFATKKFMAQLVKLAKAHSVWPGRDRKAKRPSRESVAVAEKTLALIQSWGEDFLTQRKTLPLFVETYHQLRIAGLPFAAR